jgi:hypothetical protein
VFIDETWTATNMASSDGRCANGERLWMGFPHGHRKTTTLLAGLRMTGMVAPMAPGGPMLDARQRDLLDRVGAEAADMDRLVHREGDHSIGIASSRRSTWMNSRLPMLPIRASSR